MAEASTPELYLIIDSSKLPTPQELEQALSVARLSCVAFLVADDAEPATLAPLVASARAHSAVLLSSDAVDVTADGLHLNSQDRSPQEVALLRKELGDTVNLGVLVQERHDAMEFAEAGVDYVAFDIASDNGPALVSWWHEMFTVPSVAWNVTSIAQIGAAARARADFIAIGSPPDDLSLAQWVAVATETLTQSEPV